MSNAKECPKCESDDIEIIEVGSIEPNGFYPSGEEKYKQELEYKCSFCNHTWKIQADEFIDNSFYPTDGLEPQESYDPNYASEQYRKMIEKEW